MYRVGDPFSEKLVGLVIDRYSVWGIWPALLRRDESATNPVVNHPKADAIPVADLLDIEGVVGRLWCRDAVFIS